MRFTFARTSLLCGSLVLLSGCYSNGKFHSPTWSEMAWWKKDKAPASSLAAPSVTKPSDEALAAKGSPGVKADMAPPYDSKPTSYNATGGAAGNTSGGANSAAVPAGGNYASTGYPSTGAAPAAPSTNWNSANAAPGGAAAGNPYANSGGAANSYSAGGRYDTRGADATQSTPYGGTYTMSPASTASRGGAPATSGASENPYYRGDAAAARGQSRDLAAEGDRYGTDRYGSGELPANRYSADRYGNDSSASVATRPDEYRGAPSDANGQPPRTAMSNDFRDSRSSTPATGGAPAYDPGNTGYRPAAVPAYQSPGDINRGPSPYQPGGTSRYPTNGASGGVNNIQPAGSSAPIDNGSRGYGDSRYGETPRYPQDTPAPTEGSPTRIY